MQEHHFALYFTLCDHVIPRLSDPAMMFVQVKHNQTLLCRHVIISEHDTKY